MRAMIVVGVVVTALAGSIANAKPQAAKASGDEMIEKYLGAETDKLSQKVLDGAKTLDEWQQKRPRLKDEYLYMLGLSAKSEKTPLKPVVTGSIEHEGVVIEKLHFQSKPGLYVTGNLYRPKRARNDKQERLPTILYVCGHSNRGRDGNKTAFQDHGMWFASNGYNALLIDTLQLGEIPGVHHGTYGRPWIHIKKYEASRERQRPEDILENRWWWHAAGFTPSGVEAWNGIRAIDYLVTRPDVDPERIGVTGISGGGAATFWIAAADERVKVAVPVSGMSDLESYVKNKVINGHCDCMFLYNTFQWEWTTIAALVAPRPLLFANSDNDKIFPMDGNRRIIERLRTLYKMYGKPDLVDEYVSKGGHDYRPDLRVAIFKFIDKHLKNDTKTPVKDADFKPIPNRELRVFAEDKDIPKDAINAKIDETFVPRAKVELPEKGKFDEWKQSLVNQLRERSFRSLPKKVQPAKDRGSLSRTWFVETERGIHLFLQTGGMGRFLQVWDAADDKDQEWLAKFDGQIRMTIVPRGPSEVPKESWHWTTKSPPNYVDRSHLLLGRTLDDARLWDVVATFRMLEDQNLKLIGRGQAGILAAYAAIFEPSIKEVVIIDPPKSHKEGPYFLNVLRVLDIPEALGMLAPTKLTLINARDPAFDRVEEIYKRAGAADKLTRK
jgi:cephalosporin-C deacetylase-like acetyl esterase